MAVGVTTPDGPGLCTEDCEIDCNGNGVPDTCDVDDRPVTYDMPNGQTLNELTYWDEKYGGDGDTETDGAALSDGLGQLVDGKTGADDPAADLGDGIVAGAPDTAAQSAPVRLMIDHGDRAELDARVAKARQLAGRDDARAWRALRAQGIYRGSGRPAGKVAFLFPGQGSQYLDMGRELARTEPEDFLQLWESFGTALKEGVHEDAANRERLAKLLRYPTTAGDRDKAFVYIKQATRYYSYRRLALQSNLYDRLRSDPRFKKIVGNP